MVHALAGALALGAVMTLGDYVWEALRLRHRVGYGIAHGALMCLSLGTVIGWRARRVAMGAAAGPLVGVAAAGVFYLLAPLLRYSAMFPAWMFFWICFALLQHYLRPEDSWKRAALRGVIAALLSGLAFYVISGIWTRPSPGGPNYVRNFLSWSFAFLPGFVALFHILPFRGWLSPRRAH
jgi:hypothetical protein